MTKQQVDQAISELISAYVFPLEALIDIHTRLLGCTDQPSRKRRVDYVTTWNEWKDKSKVSQTTFTARLRYGWTPEKAALTSVMKPGNYRKKLFTGEQMKIAESNGVSIRTAWHRYYVLGWSTEKAVSTPIMSRKESGRLGGKKKTGG